MILIEYFQELFQEKNVLYFLRKFCYESLPYFTFTYTFSKIDFWGLLSERAHLDRETTTTKKYKIKPL